MGIPVLCEGVIANAIADEDDSGTTIVTIRDYEAPPITHFLKLIPLLHPTFSLTLTLEVGDVQHFNRRLRQFNLHTEMFFYLRPGSVIRWITCFHIDRYLWCSCE